MHTTNHARTAHSILALALITLSGCTARNPLFTHASDYGDILPAERLRRVTPRDFSSFKQEGSPEASSTALDEIRARMQQVTQVDLTLEECRASALTNNLDLKVAVIAPTIAAQQVSEEEARFAAAFTLRGSWSQTDSATASDLESSQAKSRFIEPGVSIPLRTGGTASIGLPISRNETDNQFSTLNPAYTSDLALSISQPLLRGAGRRANMAGLKIASLNRQATEAATTLEVIRQLAAVDRAYWRLYQARQELDVTQQQYELADALLARAQRQVNAGASPEIEVIRAQSGLAERLEAILIAENAVLQRQRELKQVINRPDLPLESSTLLVAATPPDPVRFEFDSALLITQALDNRMDMLELELRLAADAAQVDIARNNALPLLTLDYTYRVNGLGGSLNNSFDTLGRNNFEDWSLGLNAEIPLNNEQARARVRQAILGRIQRLATKESRSLAIRTEVLGAIDQIQTTWQRIIAARQSSILAARTLAGEERQFAVGKRTSTDVLDAASRLALNQLAEIRALTDYQIAQIDLAFATGTLLGAGKVSWEPAATPEVGHWGGEVRSTPSDPETQEPSTPAPGAADDSPGLNPALTDSAYADPKP